MASLRRRALKLGSMAFLAGLAVGALLLLALVLWHRHVAFGGALPAGGDEPGSVHYTVIVSFPLARWQAVTALVVAWLACVLAAGAWLRWRAR